MINRTALPAAALVLIVGLAVAGCTSTTPNSAGPTATSTAAANQPSAPFNDVDVTFLTGMYPHHAQALTMATMVAGRTTTPAIVELATRIKAEQQPEIDTITGLLARFHQPAPATDPSGSSMAGMAGMAGMTPMTGMMSAEDMSRLGTLSGRPFDKAWLTMMTQHHAGAIDMATVELAGGVSADAQALATRITAAQRAEIATMKTLLAAP